MKVINKELVLLSKEDIEKAVLRHEGKKIPISKMGCYLDYYLDEYSAGSGFTIPDGMNLRIVTKHKEIDGLELFFDKDNELFLCDGKEISLNERALSPNEIFDFDVNIFNRFYITPRYRPIDEKRIVKYYKK